MWYTTAERQTQKTERKTQTNKTERRRTPKNRKKDIHRKKERKTHTKKKERRGILKAPPANPRTYIYWYYNIDPTEGSYYVRKSLKIRKKVDNGLLPRKNCRQRCFMLHKCNVF